nr:MAG TPA: hypothetical protein [Caudoviricetes sp.]
MWMIILQPYHPSSRSIARSFVSALTSLSGSRISVAS